MPILKTVDTKELILPESGAKLTIFNRITYGMMTEIWELPKADKESMLRVAAMLIVDWDFTNEKGEKLPIDLETLKSLSRDDGQALISEVSSHFAEKKTSPSKS